MPDCPPLAFWLDGRLLSNNREYGMQKSSLVTPGESIIRGRRINASYCRITNLLPIVEFVVPFTDAESFMDSINTSRLHTRISRPPF
ncbi:hypothetical protein CEXT_384651 [Caerostris extrusa]|uniref:Uncharacterized protein n=1 Tax=Caerostris extrusa TaxID=172846 RepID=A0AAV4RVT9_CAEEX|nr:hypothetical protein CEXT_384651 [Caerostris extrusa]